MIRHGKARQKVQGNIRTRKMLATTHRACVLWLAVREHCRTAYNARAMALLSLGTSNLLEYPISARSETSAEYLRFLPGTRLEFLCGQPWLPFEEYGGVRGLCCGLSDH